MSFSSDVKEQICRIDTNQEHCLLSELSAILWIMRSSNSTIGNNERIKIATENAAFARRVFSIIKKLYNICIDVSIRRNSRLKKNMAYILSPGTVKTARKIFEDTGFIFDEKDNIVSYSNKKIIKRACCKKSFLRGVFLSAGYISDPEKSYHLELICHDFVSINLLYEVISYFNLKAKTIKRKDYYIVYFKESESVVDFLNIIGAYSALLKLENIRVLKDMRNSVNRIVNCETANLEKMVSASFRQIESIKYIINRGEFKNLSSNLKAIAEIRMEYPDASLLELGNMLTPHLGKSGVNHRLRKIEKIAENLKKK